MKGSVKKKEFERLSKLSDEAIVYEAMKELDLAPVLIEVINRLANAVLSRTTISTEYYDPNYGDNKLCTCGHIYYRHFNTYEGMNPCGCKYCPCKKFQPISIFPKANNDQ